MPRSRGYGMVPMPPPQPIDVAGNATSLLHLASIGQQFDAQQAEQASHKAIESAYAQNKGSLTGTISTLEQQGRWREANDLKARESKIRADQVDALGKKIDEHKTIFGKGAEFLNTVQARPELYPQLRPKLLEMAGSLDPRLAAEIPEQYDAPRVKAMLDFTTGAAAEMDARAKAVDALKTKFTEKEHAAKSDEIDRTVVGHWFSVSPNQEDWDLSVQHAREMGVSDAVLQKIGPTWSPDGIATAKAMLGPEKAPNTTEYDDYLASYARDVAKKPVADLTEAQRRNAKALYTAAGRDPNSGSSTLGPSPESRAVAERWKQAALDRLEQRYLASKSGKTILDDLGNEITVPPMSPQDLTDAKARIQSSYLEQIGSSSTPKGKPSTVAAPAKPAAAPGGVPSAVSSVLKGQKAGKYTLNDGSVWMIGNDGQIAAGR